MAAASRLIALLVLVSFSPFLARAADWPQWLGPNRDGSTTETIAAWKDDPKVVWRKPVGEGHSSPVVAGGLVFLHTRVADKEEEAVTAFDAKTGEPKWQKSYARASAKNILFGQGPRATLTVDGNRLYTFGITGVLSCWDTADGKQHWQLDALKQFGAPNLFFGVSSSPLIAGDLVLVQVGNDAKRPQGTCVVAFKKESGDVAWKALDDNASYSSPILSQGKAIYLTGANLVALDPKNGDVSWKHPFRDLLNESSSTPVRIGDVLIGSSVMAGSIGLKLSDMDGKTAVKEIWKDKALTCYFSTPLDIGNGHVYLVTGKPPPFASATLHCVETATGKIVWSKEKIGTYHAALTRMGDGNVLMLDDHGHLSLLAPDTKQYKELARSKVLPGKGDIWAHPAVADGEIYLRDGKQLICLEIGK
jgi:outer membrane protein assembly factor BamB